MRNVLIKKEVGALGCDADITILFSEKPAGVLKVDMDQISLPINKTEHAVQGEIIDENGKSYRSNAFFVLNGKCPELTLVVSGHSLKLFSHEEE
ncbi:MAG: hypothetical protein J6I69_01445 [Bacilli bacterium]|jgi:hypothetical protein|nr:hypothetical protein [Bacilli bacterium]